MNVSIKDVAKRAGVSISTVSRVMNGTKWVSPDLRKKVEEAIEELNYSANSIARSLKKTRTNKIAFVITAISRIFFTDILEGISREAGKNGYSVVIAETHDSIDNEIQQVEFLADQWVDGIILASSAYGDSEKVRNYVDNLHKLNKKGQRIPVITIEFPLANEKVDAITVDNRQAAYEAVSYLIRQIHCRNIIHISIPFEHYLGQERISGYRRALEENGLPFDERNIIEGDYTSYFGYKAMRRLAEEKRAFDGIFCANDQMAVGVLKACEELGIRVPEDVAVIGNDDVFVASVVSPSLSSIHVPKFEMGQAAMKRLHELICAAEAGEELPKREVVLLRHEIVERETTVRDKRKSLKSLSW